MRDHFAVLVCFACSPVKGSEEGVGWSWVMLAAEHFEKVVVITSDENLSACKAGDSLWHVDFVAPSRSILCFDRRYKFWRFVEKLPLKPGLEWSYGYWLSRASALISEFHSTAMVIHHVTFANGRQALPRPLDFSGKLVWGPIGGILTTPPVVINLISSFVTKSHLRLRNMYISRMLQKNKNNGSYQDRKIFCAGELTSRALGCVTGENHPFLPEIVLDKPKATRKLSSSNLIRLIWTGGRTTELKGWALLELIIKCLADRIQVSVVLSIFVSDYFPAADRIKRFSNQNIAIDIITGADRAAVMNAISNSDLLLSTSLHDLTSSAMAEAACLGTPAFGFKVGEMQSIFNRDNFIEIQLLDDRSQLVKDYCAQLALLLNDAEKLRQIKNTAAKNRPDIGFKNARNFIQETGIYAL